MPYASVVLDIPTRALDRAYDYRVPPQLADEAVVGATVLVTFSHRAAVGYVVGLSADAPVSRVTIRNVHGNFYVSAVWLTHHFWNRPAPGRFDDIVISDIFAAKAIPPPDVDGPWRRSLPLIYVEGVANIGSLVMERIFRDERTLTAPTFGIDRRETHVDSLVIRDCRMTNRLGGPIRFFDNKGTVDSLVNEGNTFVGEWEKVNGHIQDRSRGTDDLERRDRETAR